MPVAAAVACFAVLAASERGEIAGRVLEAVQGARRAAGVAALERRADLDELARARAVSVASLPHRKRLHKGTAIGAELQRAPRNGTGR